MLRKTIEVQKEMAIKLRLPENDTRPRAKQGLETWMVEINKEAMGKFYF